MTSSKRRAVVITAIVAAVTALILAFAASASAHRGYWGAIAVDPETGITGKSFDFPTAKAAQRQAIAVCEVRGDGCKVAVWVTNGWAALVKKHNGVYIGGLARTKKLAIADARGRAHEQTAAVVATVFSG
jgi:hypothetical protein